MDSLLENIDFLSQMNILNVETFHYIICSFIEIELIHNVVLVLGVQQNGSVINTYTHICICTHVHIHMHTYVCVCTYIYVCVQVCMCVCMASGGSNGKESACNTGDLGFLSHYGSVTSNSFDPMDSTVHGIF